MPKAVRGVLVQCDESIMAIILKIDAEHSHSFIMETFDDETCLVSSAKLNELKAKLKEVRSPYYVNLTPN
jgi:TFIIH basal transcription factor complex TTD-A subunit